MDGAHHTAAGEWPPVRILDPEGPDPHYSAAQSGPWLSGIPQTKTHYLALSGRATSLCWEWMRPVPNNVPITPTREPRCPRPSLGVGRPPAPGLETGGLDPDRPADQSEPCTPVPAPANRMHPLRATSCTRSSRQANSDFGPAVAPMSEPDRRNRPIGRTLATSRDANRRPSGRGGRRRAVKRKTDRVRVQATPCAAAP
jgi:hypothetical protein